MKKTMRKSMICLTVLCLGLTLLAGCGKKDKGSETANESGAVTFKDALGNEVSTGTPKKAAVLSESLADAWQLAGGTVAATTEDASEFLSKSEGMINLGALKSPNVELMISEGVDFAVLSATISEHVDLRNTLESAGIKTAYFEAENFTEYADMMKIMTDLTGNKEMYKKNVEDIQAGIKEQIARADGSEPSVLFLRAYSTGVKAKGSDSMTGQMLKDLGCVNIADSEGSLLDDLSMEAIIDKEPDFIFVTTMGESEEAAMDMVEQLLTSNPAWNGLKAVKENHYYVLPKELFHNKPNERWGESYQILADYLYGEK